MPLGIPLPRVVADVGPGGGIVTAMRGINALTNENLDNQLKAIESQYYGPKTEAQIAYQNALTNKYNLMTPLEAEHERQLNQVFFPRSQAEIAQINALTQGRNIENQFSPEKLQLANQYQKFVNQNYIPSAENRNALIKQQTIEQQIKNSFLPQTLQSEIQAQKALADYRQIGGGYGMGAGQKELLGLQRQIQRDNPQFTPEQVNQAASAALMGQTVLPDGTPLPALSGLAKQEIAQIQKRSSTSAIQNQAANMDVLASDLNNIDITPLTKFAGLKGRTDYLNYVKDMTLGKEVPQEFRDYLAFKDITSNFAMDSLRKGFGTSVVPGYVYATLGKASNPNSTWWHDPKQVVTEWNATKSWINDNAKKYKIKATQGSGADIGTEWQKQNSENIKTYNPSTGRLE